MREIDYEKLVANYDEMINVMEHDSSRSAGKARINASTLVNLHALKDKYQTKLNSLKQPTKKKEVADE